MKFAKKLLSESAAGGGTGAGAVAAYGGMLFGPRPVKRLKKRKKKAPVVTERKAFKRRVGKFAYAVTPDLTHFEERGPSAGDNDMPQNMDFLKYLLNERIDTNEYDPDDVISKLKAAQQKEQGHREHGDTVKFGLEDDEGNTVRVVVRADQAPEFEKALQVKLSDVDKDDQEEIAEILYQLKDRFDIVDIEWPEIPEDEEENQEVAPAGGEAKPGAEPGAEPGKEGAPEITEPGKEGGGEDLLGAMEEPGGEAGGGEESAKTALDAVIDMMKADAEARKAEAEARKAEARAKESQLAFKQAHARVKQEEELLDMEEFEKGQKEADQEAKKLAKLAKWRRQVDTGEEPESPIGAPGFGGKEEEEKMLRHLRFKRASTSSVSDMIRHRIKGTF